MIGLLLPDISNPYFPLLMKGIEENARENGYSVILGNVEEGSRAGESYMTLLFGRNVAVLFRLSKELRISIPCRSSCLTVFWRVMTMRSAMM
ncbi:MAG: hypothetical protein U5K84_03565 [Alkalibacterium sp.]|nr:hypothetical protein [Alkalibacterium sp.]